MEYTIRLANDNDKDSVLNLLNDVFSENQRTSYVRGDDYWYWKYINNPFGKAILSVAEFNGTIIGVDNLWPWQFIQNDIVIKALQPCDSVVHQDFRGNGIFRALRTHGLKTAIKGGYTFLFNFPNKNSLHLNLSLNYSYLGKIPWMVKVIDPVGIMKLLKNDLVSEPFLVDDKYLVNSNVLDDIADNYDKGYKDLININRIKGFHNWRYNEKPGRKYGMFLYEKKNEVCVIVFTMNKKGENKEFIVVDTLGESKLIVETLKTLIKELRKTNISYASIMVSPVINKSKMFLNGFMPVRYKNMVVKTLDNANYNNEFDRFKDWNLVAALHDSI